jgi:hypothetical protein
VASFTMYSKFIHAVACTSFLCVCGGGALEFELRARACKAGALLLEPHLQPILLYFGDGISGTICPGWPQTHNPYFSLQSGETRGAPPCPTLYLFSGQIFHCVDMHLSINH